MVFAESDPARQISQLVGLLERTPGERPAALVVESVAELVVRQARCPVVVVRAPGEERAGAEEAR